MSIPSSLAPSSRVPVRVALLSLFAQIALWQSIPQADAQFATISSSQGSQSNKREPLQRSLAAIDLAIMAAESGVLDVSFDAVQRAVAKGPPVSAFDLGGLLSNASSTRTNIGMRRSQTSDPASAQVALSLRLQKLDQAWQDVKVDPVDAYNTWKRIVFPPDRPNEVFMYSTVNQSNNITYSSFNNFEPEEPVIADTGANRLVMWAIQANRVGDLKDEIRKHENFPTAKDGALLLKLILALNTDASPDDVQLLLAELKEHPKVLINQPNAQLLLGHVWKLLNQTSSDTDDFGQELIDSLLAATVTEPSWASNEWLKFLVARRLGETTDRNDQAEFDKTSQVAMSMFNSLSSNNAEYVASVEGELYLTAADRAFGAGHFDFGSSCLKKRSTLAIGSRYDRTSSSMLDPRKPTMQALLSAPREKRYELLTALIFKMPSLGLTESIRIGSTEHVPTLFAAADSESVSEVGTIRAEDRIVSTLLEWTLRDAIALNRQDEILKEIAKLEAAGSDDARLARMILKWANDERADVSVFATEKDGKPTLRATIQDDVGSPLDLQLLQDAYANEAYVEHANNRFDELLETCRRTNRRDLLSWLCRIRADAQQELGNAPITHQQLKHWIVANDLLRQDLRNGHVATTQWSRREDGSWGHDFSPQSSFLLLRFPIEGSFTASLRTKDGSHQESAPTYGGLVSALFRYNETVATWAIGQRDRVSQPFVGLQEGYTPIVLQRDADSLSLRAAENTESDALRWELASTGFPFFGVHAPYYRLTSFDSVKLEGDITIPDQVSMLSPSLLGWSTRFTRQLLPTITLDPKSESTVTRELVNLHWHVVDDQLESVDRVKVYEQTKQTNSQGESDPPQPGPDGLIQYVRPLCDGESISLEFFYEPEKFGMAPALGRIAMVLDKDPNHVLLHWLPAEPKTRTDKTRTDDREPADEHDAVEIDVVADPDAEQLAPIQLLPEQWNSLTVRLDGETVTLRLNGTDVYRRDWETVAGKNFGVFHEPSKYHVRVRNVILKGDWPQQLPADLMEVVE